MNSLQRVNITVSQLGRRRTARRLRAAAMLTERRRSLKQMDHCSMGKLGVCTKEASAFRDPTVSELAAHSQAVWAIPKPKQETKALTQSV